MLTNFAGKIMFTAVKTAAVAPKRRTGKFMCKKQTQKQNTTPAVQAHGIPKRAVAFCGNSPLFVFCYVQGEEMPTISFAQIGFCNTTLHIRTCEFVSRAANRDLLRHLLWARLFCTVAFLSPFATKNFLSEFFICRNLRKDRRCRTATPQPKSSSRDLCLD